MTDGNLIKLKVQGYVYSREAIFCQLDHTRCSLSVDILPILARTKLHKYILKRACGIVITNLHTILVAKCLCWFEHKS